VAFRFDDDYKRLVPRPVLSQSFEDDLDRTYRSKRDVLPAFFANLVPEGQLRELIESSLAIPQGDSLALLAAVSTDLPGAVELVETGALEVELNGEDEDGGEARRDADARRSRPDSLEPGVELRFSLAGVQIKFSLIREHEKLTLPARGGRGEVIVKLDSSQFRGVVDNEYAILQWARASGFEVPACELLPVRSLPEALRRYAGESERVLVVDRYDRIGQTRIHQEDFAQVTGILPALKYDHITYAQCAALVRNIVGDAGYHESIARLTFVLASGNADAHLKNWSILYRDGVNPSLTPLYDQVSTVAWPEVSFKLALKLAETRDFLQVNEQTFARLAARAGADPRTTIAGVRSALERIVAGWRAARTSEILPPGHVAALRAYWRRSPLLKDVAVEAFGVE
jgi:serine/threonine-protein kinase HipA